MRGKRARAIRRAARQFAKGPTMWRRVNQRDRRGGVIREGQVICSPGSFRALVKQFKRDCVLL